MDRMIKETLGKTVEIGMFESVRQGDRVIPFGEFRNLFLDNNPDIDRWIIDKGHTCYID